MANYMATENEEVEGGISSGGIQARRIAPCVIEGASRVERISDKLSCGSLEEQ